MYRPALSSLCGTVTRPTASCGAHDRHITAQEAWHFTLPAGPARLVTCTLPPPSPHPTTHTHTRTTTTRSGASYYEGSFSNISRNPAGDYVAVSSRGNFFMTWEPGEGCSNFHSSQALVVDSKLASS